MRIIKALKWSASFNTYLVHNNKFPSRKLIATQDATYNVATEMNSFVINASLWEKKKKS